MKMSGVIHLGGDPIAGGCDVNARKSAGAQAQSKTSRKDLSITRIPTGLGLRLCGAGVCSVSLIILLASYLSSADALAAEEVPSPKPIIQDSSGFITLAASNAITHGSQLRYEPATNKNCLGYWTKVEDWAEWQFEVTKPGLFEIEVWQGCGKGQGGSEVAVEAGDQRFNFTVEDTGHFQNFVPRHVGTVRFTSPGRQSLSLKPQRKQANAVMDIRQVRLIPVIPKPKAPLHKQAASEQSPRLSKSETNAINVAAVDGGVRPSSGAEILEFNEVAQAMRPFRIETFAVPENGHTPGLH